MINVIGLGYIGRMCQVNIGKIFWGKILRSVLSL